jgi:hypothetical protein
MRRFLPSRDTGTAMSAEWFGACGGVPWDARSLSLGDNGSRSIPASGWNSDPATPADLVSRSTGGSRVGCCCVGGPSRDGSRSRSAGPGCRRPMRSRPHRCPADDGEHGPEEPGAGHRPDHDQGSVDQQVHQQVNPEVPLLLPPLDGACPQRLVIGGHRCQHQVMRMGLDAGGVGWLALAPLRRRTMPRRPTVWDFGDQAVSGMTSHPSAASGSSRWRRTR